MHRPRPRREALLQARDRNRSRPNSASASNNSSAKTETAATAPADGSTGRPDSTATAAAGQQRGKPGPKRRDYSHLPAVVEEQILGCPEQCCCSRCGQPFAAFPGHRGLHHPGDRGPGPSPGHPPPPLSALPAPVVPSRHRHRPPPARRDSQEYPGRLDLGHVLLDKYLFYRPTYRLLADLRTHGLDLSLGTLTDGLQRLLPLFEPLYEALVERRQAADAVACRRDRWLVFVTVEGQGRLPLVSVGLSCRGGGRLRAGAGPVA